MSESMSVSHNDAVAPIKLRIWPAVLIIATQWIVISAMAFAYEGTMLHFMSMFMGPSVAAFLILVWWLFFSRVSWFDALLIPMIIAGLVAKVMFVGHETIGAFGIMMFALPTAMTAWIVFLVISFPLNWGMFRRLGSIVILMSTFGYLLIVRMDGVSGGMSATMSWRWLPTTEEIFLAEREGLKLDAPGDVTVGTLTLQPGDWPSFRGPNRDNRISGVKIPTDWSANPPKLLWKHKVGPGWGSFAVVGKFIFTQEQWDQDEAVICYDGDTGKIVWSHKEPARFTEAVAGPGPRATPTFADGKLYTMGAAGKLCCLDAATGKVIWSQNILEKTDAKVPQWGFAASPLLMDGNVMVFAGGEGKAVVAYDAKDGTFAWAAGNGKLSYCSLQTATVDGVEQALLMHSEGLTAFQPKDGKILWDHQWPFEGAARCIQPAAVGKADFLIGSGFGNGTRRINVSKKDDKWSTKDVWTTRAISPYFNDFVIQGNNLFGFNGEIFTSVNLDKGKLNWKERAYGCGQVLLLTDQNLLLVTTEKGEIVLLEANSEEHKELARIPGIDGKTWNHPVLAHGRLYIRNGEEAACYVIGEAK